MVGGEGGGGIFRIPEVSGEGLVGSNAIPHHVQVMSVWRSYPLFSFLLFSF